MSTQEHEAVETLVRLFLEELGYADRLEALRNLSFGADEMNRAEEAAVARYRAEHAWRLGPVSDEIWMEFQKRLRDLF